MHHPDPTANPGPPARPPRWSVAAGVAAAVLLLHATLLGLLPTAPGPGRQGDAPRPLQVRQIVAPAAAVTPPAAPATAMTFSAAARRPAGGSVGPTARRNAPAVDAPAAAVPQPTAPQQADGPSDPTQPALPSEQAPPGGVAVPVYATRLPATATLRYELRRGAQRGQAVLSWNRGDDSFELTLNNDGLGAQSLGSSSRGHLTPAGLAPERHTESRRGREVRAANFQYDSARITFSGPGIEYPLVPGAQDRLSWMLQLAAILEANPALQATGSEVLMFVAGSRGDGEVWTFTVQDRDGIELPAGRLAQPVHLKREPRRPYDTAVEVWLDPARGHLPVRVHQWVRPTGQGVELLLDTLSTP